MAGGLTLSTLNDSSGVLATQNGMNGIAKAWVNFNGTGTVNIRSSFNVSSITDNGTGDYSINFITPLSNADGSIIASGSHDNGSYAGNVFGDIDNTPLTTSRARINCLSVGSNANFIDLPYVYVAIFSL